VALAVVQPERLAGLEDVDVDPQLLERPLALEVATDAERPVVAPATRSRIDHEPAVAVGDETELGGTKRYLGDAHCGER
jgi:hypothetical protein